MGPTKSESRATTLNEPSTCQITSETETIASKSSGVDYKKPTKEEDEEEEVSPISLLFSSSEEEAVAKQAVDYRLVYIILSLYTAHSN